MIQYKSVTFYSFGKVPFERIGEQIKIFMGHVYNLPFKVSIMLWAVTLCPVPRCNLVYRIGWSLFHVSYSSVLSTKLHLKFSELACFDNERIDLHLTL